MEAKGGGKRRSAHTRDPIPGISFLPGGSLLAGSSFPQVSSLLPGKSPLIGSSLFVMATF